MDYASQMHLRKKCKTEHRCKKPIHHQEKLSEKSWHHHPAQLRPPSLSSAMLYICIGGGGGRCILKKGRKGKLMLSRFTSSRTANPGSYLYGFIQSEFNQISGIFFK